LAIAASRASSLAFSSGVNSSGSPSLRRRSLRSSSGVGREHSQSVTQQLRSLTMADRRAQAVGLDMSVKSPTRLHGKHHRHGMDDIRIGGPLKQNAQVAAQCICL
jgi:hypothetical protein